MAIYMWREQPDYLCFTANTSNCSIALTNNGNPTAVTLETSTDGINWTTYIMSNYIPLSNIWDKVYFRNTSTTTTGFSLDGSNYYNFVIRWSVAASWDVTSLINKNCTDTLVWNYCFYILFYNCSGLVTAPILPATTLTQNCYRSMFQNCTNLEEIPKLPAITLTNRCYYSMFAWCSKIKLSETQTWEYQTLYRIPTTWTWTTLVDSLNEMFTSTWWTFTWRPSINTTYYTSNQVI